jgi:DNA polymerase-3 subunit epsilon
MGWIFSNPFSFMELKLKRPIAFFDLETTGLNITTDRIIEICILKVHPDQREEVKTMRLNPEMEISAESTRITGITNKDVQACPTFKSVAYELLNFLQNCDLAGYNALKFDIPILMEEFLRAGVDFDLKKRKLVDVQNIFMKMEPRTLKGAYRFFCNLNLEDAHSAEADTRATFQILKAQLDKYENSEYEDRNGKVFKPIENDINALHDFSAQQRTADLAGQIILNDQNQEVFHFGKHKGKTVEEVFQKEPSYYDWMMKGEFPLYTKKLITSIKLRTFGKNTQS